MPGAVQALKSDNNLPAICVMGIKHEPVAIGRLERYVADMDRFLRGDIVTEGEAEATAAAG